MKNEIIDEKLDIENKIYEIRGKQVMLDSDLAKLYECTNGTKDINKAVKRNIERFPEEFYFKLTDEEQAHLWFQIGTANNMTRTNCHVFTEQGVAMLASVLHTTKAIKTSIRIINAFVKMRHYINFNMPFLPHKILLLENKVDENTKRIDELFDKFNPDVITDEFIYYEHEFYDAYSIVIDIFKTAVNELIIIDNYADKELLDIIRNLDVKVTIITKTKSLLTKKDIEKYNMQYNNLKIIYDNSYHDRYFILDNAIIYHCGASINKIGNKTFSISIIRERTIIKSLLEKINLKIKER